MEVRVYCKLPWIPHRRVDPPRVGVQRGVSGGRPEPQAKYHAKGSMPRGRMASRCGRDVCSGDCGQWLDIMEGWVLACIDHFFARHGRSQ